ncbi:lanthionine synthetase C family protein [Streptomyces sp. NPDC050732]|uniref:lanthionine synthetase C family protein n=1 Tax=Streptomyces sp. NPDC050732 TaxID=3154632 RepID=UPI00343B5227
MTALHELGEGLAGTALYEAVAARSSGRWEAAHSAARTMASQPATTHRTGASLYRGAPAVAFALHTAGHPAYRTALAALDERIRRLIQSRLGDAHRRMDTHTPPCMREYDLISGLTGLGAYLHYRGTQADLLDAVLRYLVRLIEEPVQLHGNRLPGWWTSDGPRGKPEEGRPLGHGNFGMAHGVSGPIALLALCARAGHEVPGQRQALVHACRVLKEWARPQPGRACWPETVTAPQWLAKEPQRPRPGRPSWCYGTPGIARSLQLAALACQQTALQHEAEDILTVCASDPEQLALLDDMTVCHGWSGFSLVLHRAAADAREGSALRQLGATVHARLRALTVQGPLPRTPGLLTGADGIQLTMHTLTLVPAVAPGWDTCLLLA